MFEIIDWISAGKDKKRTPYENLEKHTRDYYCGETENLG